MFVEIDINECIVCRSAAERNIEHGSTRRAGRRLRMDRDWVSQPPTGEEGKTDMSGWPSHAELDATAVPGWFRRSAVLPTTRALIWTNRARPPGIPFLARPAAG